jgi:uncharacterized protein with HEPN domain
MNYSGVVLSGSSRFLEKRCIESGRTIPLYSAKYGSIASFRNILVHGYDSIDHTIVWGIIEEDLGKLLENVKRLIEEEDRTDRRT